MIAFALRLAGWCLLLLVLVITVKVIIANPHGSAQLVRDTNARVGTFASGVASRLPSPQASPQQAQVAAHPSPDPTRTVIVQVTVTRKAQP